MAQGCRKATGRRYKYPGLQAIDARHRGMRPRVEADAALAAASQEDLFARDVHGVGHWSRGDGVLRTEMLALLSVHARRAVLS